MANLNCQLLATRGAQPNVFKHTGFVWLGFGLNQIQLAFAEITERIGTFWIRALREHAISGPFWVKRIYGNNPDD
jgi:hypothetical protein